MSITNCICCYKHRLRTAVCWDPYSPSNCRLIAFWTYSKLIQTSLIVSKYLKKACKETSFLVQVGYGVCSSASSSYFTNEHVIAVYGHTCPEVLSALIGIMSVPAAYLPLNILQASSNKIEMLWRSGVGVVVVQESLLNSFLEECMTWFGQCTFTLDCGLVEYGLIVANLQWKSSVDYRNIDVEEGSDIRSKTPFENFPLDTYTNQVDVSCTICKENGWEQSLWMFPKIHPMSIAYVLSTSGTTGQPVYVRVPHCCIVPNIVDLRYKFGCSKDDVIFNAAPLTFDPSVVEMFISLFSGAMLLTVPDSVKGSPSCLAKVLFRRHFTTVLQVTPTLVHRFSADEIQHGLLGCESHVRVLAFGGEKCPDYNYLTSVKAPGNTTSIFNLYGVTEVSSWATCYCVCESGPVALTDCGFNQIQVPLGEPLLGTKVEIRDENGCTINEGVGMIWAGGDYRVCLLEEDVDLKPGCMRCTGDVGTIDKLGRLFFSGRYDRQTKRLGHRINLDFIEETIASLESVVTCVVANTALSILSPSSASNTLKQYSASVGFNNEERQFSSRCILAFIVPQEVESICGAKSCADLHRVTFTRLRGLVHPSCLPDDLVFVKFFPVTKHGKVDVNSLVSFADPDIYFRTPVQVRLMDIIFKRVSLTVEFVMELLRETVFQVLALDNWTDNVKLTNIGASSFDIVHLTSQFELYLRIYIERVKSKQVLSSDVRDVLDSLCRDLLDNLLSKTLCEVAVCLFSKLGIVLMKQESCARQYEGSPEKNAFKVVEQGFIMEDVISTSNKGQKRLCDDTGSTVSKQPKLLKDLHNAITHGGCQFIVNSALLEYASKVKTVDTLSLRGGRTYENGRLLPHVMDSSVYLSQATVTNAKPHPPGQEITATFSVQWKVCTGKCVDASPLVSCRTNGLEQRVTVYIGSHSGDFLAIDFVSGSVRWKFRLGDRVESSACMTKCGIYIAVGCYDGQLYILDADNGTLHWKFIPSPSISVYSRGSAPDPVKSSPCVDPASGLIWFGSHDHHIYAVDVQTKSLVLKVYPGGGSCYSSPCIDSDARLLYAATLQGRVVAINIDTGSINWTYNCPKPIFSSPTLCLEINKPDQTINSSLIIAGCVDGSLYVLGSDGVLRGKMYTDNPVFSTCSVIHVCDNATSDTKLLSGSHDKCVYCWDGHFELDWKLQLDSEIYSTPCVCYPSFEVCEPSSPSGTVHEQSDPDVSEHKSAVLPCVCVCSSAGFVYLINFKTGHLLCSYHLPGEVFSSPVVFGNSIIVGCRNDYVYCVSVELLCVS